MIVTPPLELLNVAVTDVAAVTVTTQASVPLQAPLQPANTEPSDAVSVNVTCVPLAKLPEHPSGQLIPCGALVTFPLPVPASVTVNKKFVEVPAVKFATTVVAAVIVTVQVPVPSHGPAPQPANVPPFVGAAVKVTAVPLAKFAVHADGHEIPAGALVTVPVPVPPSVTVNAKFVAVPIVVVSLAELFPVFGSVTSELTVAASVIVPTPSGTMLTIMVSVAVPPFATVPKLQLSVKVPVHAAPCDGVADTKLDCCGNVFKIVTFVALFGPRFVTVTV